MLTRRRLLAAGGGVALSPLLPGQTPRRSRSPESGPGARPVLRIGFLTDVHLPAPDKNGKGRNDEVRRAIEIAQTQHRADFLVFGGDNVFAAESGPRAGATAQLENWQRLIGDAVRVGHASVLGNHDCWALARGGKEFESGRRAALRAFGMPSRYYAFERAGWRFLMLDTVHPAPGGYRAFVDAEQRAWIERQLADASPNPKPTVVVGHVPMISGAAEVAAETVHRGGSVHVPQTRIMADARDLTELFRVHPQVRLYLTGHLHMVERTRFRGVEHVNGGAVCGGWWQGEYEHFGPHLALIDLFADGRAFPRALPL